MRNKEIAQELLRGSSDLFVQLSDSFPKKDSHSLIKRLKQTKYCNEKKRPDDIFCVDGVFREEDIARSLLLSISNDIGQISYLQAKLHNLKKIYFGGYFIRGHPITMHTITYAINYWSKVSLQIVSCIKFHLLCIATLQLHWLHVDITFHRIVFDCIFYKWLAANFMKNFVQKSEFMIITCTCSAITWQQTKMNCSIYSRSTPKCAAKYLRVYTVIQKNNVWK